MSTRSDIKHGGLIGDLHTAALIGKRGSLMWLCWPNFDSEACFASLLGTKGNGEWSLSPKEPSRVKLRYLPRTLILETTYSLHSGSVVSVTDFMTIRHKYSCVVRIVRGIAGEGLVRTFFSPRFDFGSRKSRIEGNRKSGWSIVCGPHRLTMRSNAPMESDKNSLEAEWLVKEAETYYFTLQYSDFYTDKEPPAVSPKTAQHKTAHFWSNWISQSQYRGPYREPVERSLITLKALTYAPSGAFCAAPTTSLPEKVGGVRNWDYRFCWLRDTTFSLQGLIECGFTKEARAWLDWLSRGIEGDPSQLKIMYGITGKQEHSEWIADWLPGYTGSKPVRIGNKASSQLQLDTYGEVLDSLYRARRDGLYPHKDKSGEALEVPLLKHLEEIWSEPDEGLWEFRSGRQQFTQSKVMAWVAFDRGIRMANEFGIKGPVDRWRKLQKRIHADICAKGFHKGMKCFTQVYGQRHLDASLLLLPIVGFLPIDDERIAGTISAIEKHLMRDGFLLRYDTAQVKDGLPAGEGAFLVCNFWLIDVYILQGRFKEAHKHFVRLLSIRNQVGLLSEEHDPKQGLVGNFPQAFSHIGLINAALSLKAGTSIRLNQLNNRQKQGLTLRPAAASNGN
ncbi:MAG TPA: glycoside hydrolase family 15 protein [Terriglobales bacterium]|nr:glycoside hydrolase family 15 protein [Terriglobales bacterium]